MEEELQKIYKEKFVPNYDNKNYVEATKLLMENPGLDDYLDNSQSKGLLKHVLKQYNSSMQEMQSVLNNVLKNKKGY